MIMQRIVKSSTLKTYSENEWISYLKKNIPNILQPIKAHLSEFKNRDSKEKNLISFHPFIPIFLINGAQNGTSQNH